MDNLEVWITPTILIAACAFLWQQISGLRRDMETLRRDMETKFGDVRRDMETRFGDVRKDLAGLAERIGRLEGKVDFLETFITRRNDPEPAG